MKKLYEMSFELDGKENIIKCEDGRCSIEGMRWFHYDEDYHDAIKLVERTVNYLRNDFYFLHNLDSRGCITCPVRPNPKHPYYKTWDNIELNYIKEYDL